MKFRNRTFVRIILLSGSLLLSTLACRAATNLVFPSTPTSFPTNTPTPLPPTLTPTPDANAACSSLLAKIMDVAVSGGGSGLGHAGSTESSPNRDNESTPLVSYRVTGNEIGDPYYRAIPVALRSEQRDTVTQQKIWNYFTELIPADQRSMLVEYDVMTDGPENLLAAVTQAYQPDEWALEVDIADSKDTYNLTYTLVHEFGHLLTLNANQVTPSEAIFKHPKNDSIYAKEEAACPQYFPGEGCSKLNSYINEFYQGYWTSIYDEWSAIDQEQDDDDYYKKLEAFYKKYRSQFVTDYAATSPEEDIAESWSFFILSPKPTGNSIADQKVLFFYNYPELVQLRATILNNLCTDFPK
ncbi:MAG TPA: hypothetical protein VMT73_01455 [Anaerolineales bacterium]|nr:hypothetical protein [Anaerolineales bacterium]